MFDITNLPPLPPSPPSSHPRHSFSSSPSSSSLHRLSKFDTTIPQSKSITNINQSTLIPTPTPTLKKMPSSVRIFQEQHINEFAHLHICVNNQDKKGLTEKEKENLLFMENEKLEQARKLGRLKRQTMFANQFSTISNSATEDKENSGYKSQFNARLQARNGTASGSGNGNGWRPLSLLSRRQPSNKPSQLFVSHKPRISVSNPITIEDHRINQRQQQQQQQQQQQKRYSDYSTTNAYERQVEVVTPTEIVTPDLSSPLPSDFNSPEPDLALITPNQLGIALDCCPSPPPIPNKSKARQNTNQITQDVAVDGDDTNDNSIQSSTYSWASSFSGETAELRTAAHYVPSISEENHLNNSESEGSLIAEEDQEREEILNSPEKVKRRRKRIVAIAHTVRQLEGIGSRDVEDPNFYYQLVEAWNKRPGNTQVTHEPIWSPSNRLPQLPIQPPPTIPPRPHQQQEDRDRNTFDPYLAPPTWLAPPSLNSANLNASPVPSSNLEHEYDTPNPDKNYNYNYNYNYDESYSEEGNHSNESYASSNPFRYSYASTLHDLALEQGLQHGNKLMTEKAWLKSPLFEQGTYYNANTPSAPIPVGQFSMAPRVPSPGPTQSIEDSPSKLSENDDESACNPSSSSNVLQRTLRRQDANIGNQKKLDLNLGAPIKLDNSSNPVGPSLVPTNWGLGFLGNWLKDELADDDADDDTAINDKQGFHFGEEGMIHLHQDQDQNQNMMKIINTRNNNNNKSKTSSFLAQGDMINVQSNQDQNQYLNDQIPLEDNQRQQQQQQVKKLDQQTILQKQIDDLSMESIPLTINSLRSNLVLPPPLPTPEIEMISEQTGKSKLEIQQQPKECIMLAKEYQLLNPCQRQNYSIPLDILYPHQIQNHHPHPAETRVVQQHQEHHSNLNVRQQGQRQQRNQDGAGDLEVEVEVRALDQNRNQQQLQREEEESWDLSEISSSQSQSQFQTPPLKIVPRMSASPHDRTPSISKTKRTQPKTPSPIQIHQHQHYQYLTPIPIQELPPLPISPPITPITPAYTHTQIQNNIITKTPPRTPKSELRQIVPVQEESKIITPKYRHRQPTPPLLTNNNNSNVNGTPISLKKDKEILKNIRELEKVGLGYQTPPPQQQVIIRDQQQDQDQHQLQHQNYDHYSYRESMVGGIDSQMDNNLDMVILTESHPTHPYPQPPQLVSAFSDDSSSQHHLQSNNQSSTTVIPGTTNSTRTQLGNDRPDIEKAIPQVVLPSAKPSKAPTVLFILGFLLPILWFVGGWWSIRQPHPKPMTDDGQVMTDQMVSRNWVRKVCYHPDSMVKKCRYAAVISTPIIVIAIIVIVIVVIVVK
ncbi:uncharacterized protein L201_007015 [Kwoniella dendrophila CBS 6074]|uniref:Uncharacterized protein n=1 Tax=Kwoniella dendrophila CBS 6074 TaxID=1295534 RepID=A0AAX4K395_9TREE